jgi:CTP:molybdopterin cytidylyltransferase MocA
VSDVYKAHVDQNSDPFGFHVSKPSTSSSPNTRPLAAIILAAGKGRRMNSDLPKVVHPVAGEPMVKWVVRACRESGADPIVLVIGHGGESVRRQR